MHPILLDSPRITSYGLLMVLAIVIGWIMGRRNAAAMGLAAGVFDLMVPLVIGAALLGIWIGERFLGTGDRVLYLGLLPATAAGIGYCLLRKIRLGLIGDIVAAPLAMSIVIGRIGCYFAGCCWGKVCEVPWGARFPIGSAAHLHHLLHGMIPASSPFTRPLHPTQIYEAAGAAFVGMLVMNWLPIRKTWGEGFLVFAIGYALVRFAVEFLRDDDSPRIGPLRLSQAISVAVFVVCLVTWIVRRTMPALRVNPDVPKA